MRTKLYRLITVSNDAIKHYRFFGFIIELKIPMICIEELTWLEAMRLKREIKRNGYATYNNFNVVKITKF